MGSGSSKKHRPSSDYTQKRIGINDVNKSTVANARSISYPSYLASIEKHVPLKKQDSLNECKNSEIHSFEKPSIFVQRPSEPHVIALNKSTNNFIQNTKPNDDESFLQQASLPSKIDVDGKIVEDQSSLTLQEFYNILTAETWQRQPYVLVKNYLLLLDCRKKEDYVVTHIITAKHHSSLHSEYGCRIDIPGQLESFNMIVVYGDEKDNVFSSVQAKNSAVYKLRLSYGHFRRTYPFLCNDQSIKFLEKNLSSLKTWPSEILKGELFQGNATQALDEMVVKALGITHIVNITLDHPNAFSPSIKYMRIQLDDKADVDLLSWLPRTTKFIEDALISNSSINFSTDVNQKKNRVLVHCNFGRSRSSTVMLGYLMKAKRWSLYDACELLKDCRPTVQPNIGFLNQLLRFEKALFGKQITDFHKIPF